MRHTEAKCLIFDLGGVIIDLDVQKTIIEMAGIANIPPSLVESQHVNHQNFKLYETGVLNDEEFRIFLKQLLTYEGPESVLDDAWNAMILDIPAERLQLLKRLRNEHQLFLLSNTNAIHMKKVNERLAVHGADTFDAYFDKTYYSHLIRRRKPDAEIYQFVLEENNLKPEEVLFIDDNAENIAGAADLGIQTLHITTPETLLTFFDGQKK